MVRCWLIAGFQGITVGNEGGSDQLTVIRIAPGSTTDKQGLLHIGDIIAEINGVSVHTPDQLGDVIRKSGNDIKFKVIPAGVSLQDPSKQVWMSRIFARSMTSFDSSA